MFGADVKQTYGLTLGSTDYGEALAYNPDDPSNPLKGTIWSHEIGISYTRWLGRWISLGSRMWYGWDKESGDLFTGIRESYIQPHAVSLKHLFADLGTTITPGVTFLQFNATIRNIPLHSGLSNRLYGYRKEVDVGMAVELSTLFADWFDPKQLRFRMVFDWVKPQYLDSRQNLGLEATIVNRLFLRAGRRFGYELQKYSAGLGVNIPVGPVRLRADYAYLDMDVFDDVHLFSLGIGL